MVQIHTHFKRPQTRFRTVKTKSLTVPDQTLSLKVMVTKYVKGLPIAAPNFNGIYTDDDPAIDFNKMDLAEQEEAVLRASDELSDVKGRIQKEQQEKAEQEALEAQKRQDELNELREFKKKQTSIL